MHHVDVFNSFSPPKILTFKNHRDFSPIQVRLARDSNIPDYVSNAFSNKKSTRKFALFFAGCTINSYGG